MNSNTLPSICIRRNNIIFYIFSFARVIRERRRMRTIVACKGHNSCVCVIKFEQNIVPGDAIL